MRPSQSPIGDFDGMVESALPCSDCIREVLFIRHQYENGPAADSCPLLALAACDELEDRPEWTESATDPRRWDCTEFDLATEAKIDAHDRGATEQAWRDAGQLDMFGGGAS